MDKLPINISQRAFAAISAIRQQKGIGKEYALRIGLQGSGCEGRFMLGFEKNPKEDDIVSSAEGYDIVISRKHLMYLANKTLDFVQEGEAQGFRFE